MPIFGGESFFGLLETFRVLTFDGRYGGGKTSLAFYCAEYLLKTGRFRYLLSNTPSVWTDNPNDVVLRPDEEGQPTFLDAVIILDETGLFLSMSVESKQFLAFLRKGNVVLLCPSVEDVARNLKSVTVQRLMNLQIVGLPAWVYSYKVRRGMQKDVAKFVWWHPEEIFGIYDSGAFPVDDNGLGDLLMDWKELMASREISKGKSRGMRYDRRKQSTSIDEGIQSGSTKRLFPVVTAGAGYQQQTENFEGILEEIQDTIDEAQALSIKWKKRGR